MMDSAVGKGNTEGWLMVLISSTACIVGASIVFIDKVWSRRQGSILSSRAFLASSMALASGVLLVSSLAVLLPESQTRLKSTPEAYGYFLTGALLTLCLARIIHWCTPNAIHACGSDSPTKHSHHHHHDHHDQQQQHDRSTLALVSSSPTTVHNSHQEHSPSTDQPPHTLQQKQQHIRHHQKAHPVNEEQRKLITSKTPSTMDYGSTVLPNAHFRFHDHSQQHRSLHDLEEQAQHLDSTHKHRHHHHHGDSGSSNDDDNNNSDSNSGSSNSCHANSDSESEPNENINLEQEKQHFWSIGIQTAIAISFHKLPEGLIMFISSQASSSLGISIAAAMSIHNLTEGFMMALPIYYATGSRMKAFVYASLMGGLSQPLGALIGLFAFRSVTKDQEDVLFGVTFGIISGMMSFITIQSMLPQAIKVDIHHNYVVLFFFLGVLLVGLTSLLEAI